MPEYLYKVDRRDHISGRITRGRAHVQHILHRSGMVFVLNPRGQVALCTRSRKKSIGSGCLDAICCFHVLYGETYSQAARRELREETGLDAMPVYLGRVLVDSPIDLMQVGIFYVVSGEIITLDPDEAEKLRFYDFEKADSLVKSSKVTPWLETSWKKYGPKLGAMAKSFSRA